MDREPYSAFELRRQSKQTEENPFGFLIEAIDNGLPLQTVIDALSADEYKKGSWFNEKKIQNYFWILSKANELKSIDECVKCVNATPPSRDEPSVSVEIVFSTITNIGRTHDFHNILFNMLQRCDSFTLHSNEPYCVGISFVIQDIWNSWG